METLINLLILAVIFAIVAYAAWWVCVRFAMPAPIIWIVGAVLLIALLIFASRQVGGGGITIYRHS